jgi:8-amino-7-oxononanoate synthase
MMGPYAHIRSLSPGGTAASLGAARRLMDHPHAHNRSLPPEGAAASLGAARREAA